MQDHLRKLLDDEFSTAMFKDRMLAFLEGLHESRARPLLKQIESSNIDGLVGSETDAFRRRIGLYGD